MNCLRDILNYYYLCQNKFTLYLTQENMITLFFFLFYQHPNFNQGDGAYPNDVALLRLVLEGRDTSRNIITVADGSNSFVGETCIVSGWGITGKRILIPPS